MKTAQVNGNSITVKDMPKPSLNGSKGAILKVLGCGLCGSDIVKYRHGLVKSGTVLGHEVVGIIENINSDTDFKAGERIVTSHHIPCFECIYCRHGNFSMCSHFKSTNIIPGGFSEYIYISVEHLKNVAKRVPDSMSNEIASFYEPLGCCVRAIKRCGLKEGDSVLVVGLGSIGLLMSEGLKAYGYRVFGCDILEDRINLANDRGIDSFSSLDSEQFGEKIKELTSGYGADAVFMTSGADKAIDVAFRAVRMGGKIMVFSSTPKNFGYPNNEIYYKELTIMGSYSPAPADLEDSFNLLKTGMVNVGGLTVEYPLELINQAFEDTISNRIFKAYINIGG